MERAIKTVDEYIAICPKEVRGKLEKIRKTIQQAAPKSTETMEYFQIPGYSYEGYDYNGTLAWFSYSNNSIRLHVRPPVLQNYKKELGGYKATKAIISFPKEDEIPVALVKKLVKASIDVMKDKQVGEWIAYNRNGETVKRTEFK
jgi:uncharacterized protein YdhG (YjbR/CyaY superfamily)